MTRHNDSEPQPQTSPSAASPKPQRRAGNQAADGLRLDPANANRGTERGRELVERSLAECGAGRSILVDSRRHHDRRRQDPGGGAQRSVCRCDVESAGDELIVSSAPTWISPMTIAPAGLPISTTAPQSSAWTGTASSSCVTSPPASTCSGLFTPSSLRSCLAAGRRCRPRRAARAVRDDHHQARRSLPLRLFAGDVRRCHRLRTMSPACLPEPDRACWSPIRPTASSSTWSGATAPASTSWDRPRASYLKKVAARS